MKQVNLTSEKKLTKEERKEVFRLYHEIKKIKLSRHDPCYDLHKKHIKWIKKCIQQPDESLSDDGYYFPDLLEAARFFVKIEHLCFSGKQLT